MKWEQVKDKRAVDAGDLLAMAFPERKFSVAEVAIFESALNLEWWRGYWHARNVFEVK
jgi:hypothetical protein